MLQHRPEVALFLTLAIGQWIGELRIGGFTPKSAKQSSKAKKSTARAKPTKTARRSR